MNRLLHYWQQYLYNPNNSITSVGASVGLIALRVIAGFNLLYNHGLGKLMSFGEEAATFDNPIGLGPVLSMVLTVFAEFFCSLALILGLTTRLAAIPLVITMIVIVFYVHISDPFADMELGLLYLSSFTMILLVGPGRYSLDAVISAQLQRRT